MKRNTCCFTGHRMLPAAGIEAMVRRLSVSMDSLVRLGVTDFICGGALGFDMIAASMTIAKREMEKNIKLIFALPCKGQERYWTREQAQLHRELLSEADEVRYVGERYSPDCMQRRNRYMVDESAVCVCCLLRQNGGAFETVKYARERGLKVIEVGGFGAGCVKSAENQY